MNRERIDLCAVCVPVIKDRFMHAADLFEPFKVLIEEPIHISGYIAEGNDTASCITKTRAALEKTGDYRVIAIWCLQHPEGAYRDETVKVVSTGHGWCLFHELLERYQYPVEVSPL
jgi:hypothetical protein